ncbi:hypothetical protein EAG_03733 [Camponotus floridanus]|uniref:Uncharacterized protein n=1 Tax=Camponotus floridanus TaxID=104421 RepID=E2A1A0_CAMFO|nr:hypothetical protein EAG_03733 [Camponotus floridanus]
MAPNAMTTFTRRYTQLASHRSERHQNSHYSLIRDSSEKSPTTASLGISGQNRETSQSRENRRCHCTTSTTIIRKHSPISLNLLQSLHDSKADCKLATFPNRTRKPQSSGYTEASWIRGKARREDQKKQVRGWLNGVARGGRCEQARQGRGGGGGGVGNRSIRLGREDLLHLKIVVLSGNRARDPLVPNNAPPFRKVTRRDDLESRRARIAGSQPRSYKNNNSGSRFLSSWARFLRSATDNSNILKRTYSINMSTFNMDIPLWPAMSDHTFGSDRVTISPLL